MPILLNPQGKMILRSGGRIRTGESGDPCTCCPPRIKFTLNNVKVPDNRCYDASENLPAYNTRVQTFTQRYMSDTVSGPLVKPATGFVIDGSDTYRVDISSNPLYPATIYGVEIISCNYGAIDCVPFGGGCTPQNARVEFFLSVALDRFWFRVGVDVGPDPSQFAGPFAVTLPADYPSRPGDHGPEVTASPMPFGGSIKVRF